MKLDQIYVENQCKTKRKAVFPLLEIAYFIAELLVKGHLHLYPFKMIISVLNLFHAA